MKGVGWASGDAPTSEAVPVGLPEVRAMLGREGKLLPFGELGYQICLKCRSVARVEQSDVAVEGRRWPLSRMGSRANALIRFPFCHDSTGLRTMR